jgi:hypothetical protein
MVFLGVTFLESPLVNRPWIFVGYWLFCGWLTLIALLLAVYDMLRVRSDAVTKKREIRENLRRSFEADGEKDS